MHLHYQVRGCCTVSEQPKKIPCGIGLLAHVDAGKTTLSEGLLAHAGAIRVRGSVDAGTAHTDTLTGHTGADLAKAGLDTGKMIEKAVNEIKEEPERSKKDNEVCS